MHFLRFGYIRSKFDPAVMFCVVMLFSTKALANSADWYRQQLSQDLQRGEVTREDLSRYARDPSMSREVRMGSCQAAFPNADCEAMVGAASAPPAGAAPAPGASPSQTRCEAEHETAQLACNTLGAAGMSPQEGMMFEMMLNQAIGMAGQMQSQGQNMQAQCQNQADLSKLMGLLNAAKAAACMAAVSACKSTCDEEIETLAADPERKRRAERARRKCRDYTMNGVMNMNSALRHGANMMQNQNCANQTAAASTSPTPFSFPTPSDCSDPNNQSLTCFCARPENAEKQMCGGGSPGVVPGGVQAPPGGGGNGGNVPYSPDDPNNPGAANPFGALGGNNAAGGGDSQGSGGGGAPGGGGLSSLGGDGGGGPAGGREGASAITGVSGGNPSGGGGGGFGGGGGGRATGGDAGDDGFLSKLNLKRFLPGDKYKNRGLAGMSVPAKDGVTGPMGPSLWEKATRQYQEQVQKQNVILDK